MIAEYVKRLSCSNLDSIISAIEEHSLQTLQFESYFDNMGCDDYEIHDVLVDILPTVCANIIFGYLPYTFTVSMYFRDYCDYSGIPEFILKVHIDCKKYLFTMSVKPNVTTYYLQAINLRNIKKHDYIDTSASVYSSKPFSVYSRAMNSILYTNNRTQLINNFNRKLTNRHGMFVLNLNIFLCVMTSIYMIEQYIKTYEHKIKCLIM